MTNKTHQTGFETDFGFFAEIWSLSRIGSKSYSCVSNLRALQWIEQKLLRLFEISTCEHFLWLFNGSIGKEAFTGWDFKEFRPYHIRFLTNSFIMIEGLSWFGINLMVSFQDVPQNRFCDLAKISHPALTFKFAISTWGLLLSHITQ